jgi:hypothetical protein
MILQRRSFSPVRSRYSNSDRLKIDDEKSRLEEEIRRLGEGGSIIRGAALSLVRPVDPPVVSCITPVRPSVDRSRRMDTIIQLTGASESQDDMPPIAQGMASVNQDMDEATPGGNVSSRYRYSNDNDEPEYNTYYQSRNLTYPRIADESTDSPKRLSLDDRLVLYLFLCLKIYEADMIKLSIIQFEFLIATRNSNDLKIFKMLHL